MRGLATFMRPGVFAVVLLGLAGPAVAADVAYVTNQESEDVSVVDLESMTVTKTIAIGGKPAGIAVTRDGRRAYVSRPEARAISIIDTRTNAVIGEIATGGGPLGIAIHPSGSPVYVADWYSHSLLVVDPQTRKVIDSFETGQSPSGVAVSADGAVVVTADRDSNQVSFIDTASGATIARVAVGERPFGVAFSPDGAHVYVANVGGDSVSVIDAASHAVIATGAVGSHPYAAVETRGKLFVTDQYGGTVTVLGGNGTERLAQLESGEYPEGIDVGSDGRFVYVAHWFDNALTKIDAETLEIVGSVVVGDGPRAFGEFIRDVP